LYRGLFTFLLAGPIIASAAPPTGYYTTAEGKSGDDLRTALHTIIRNHHVIPYSSSTKIDTSDALKVLDQYSADTNYVVEIYTGSNELASTFGLTSGWNREHQWCDSYGLDGVQPAYSDLHNLKAIDANVNSARGNKYYDISDTNAPSYRFPAHAEAPLCSTDSDSWEPPYFQQGDIARALFYMATRYTGDVTNEPALILTDSVMLIDSTNAYMGKLSTLLAWHNADPVDTAEQLRNDRVYSLYQTNRNPFVDHPEWVNLTFAPVHTNPPILNLSPASSGLMLSWLATNQNVRLEVASSFAGAWTTVTNIPTLTNSQFCVLWTNADSRAFFRLHAQ
jgi:endonuclease I